MFTVWFAILLSCKLSFCLYQFQNMKITTTNKNAKRKRTRFICFRKFRSKSPAARVTFKRFFYSYLVDHRNYISRSLAHFVTVVHHNNKKPKQPNRHVNFWLALNAQRERKNQLFFLFILRFRFRLALGNFDCGWKKKKVETKIYCNDKNINSNETGREFVNSLRRGINKF